MKVECSGYNKLKKKDLFIHSIIASLVRMVGEKLITSCFKSSENVLGKGGLVWGKYFWLRTDSLVVELIIIQFCWKFWSCSWKFFIKNGIVYSQLFVSLCSCL